MNAARTVNDNLGLERNHPSSKSGRRHARPDCSRLSSGCDTGLIFDQSSVRAVKIISGRTGCTAMVTRIRIVMGRVWSFC